VNSIPITRPVIKDGAVGVHNGIIVNDRDLWTQYPEMKRKYDVDTEVFLSLLQMSRNSSNFIAESVKKTFDLIQGSASVAVLLDDIAVVPLATNVGSLYICPSKDEKQLMFASEKFILSQLLSSKNSKELFDLNAITQIVAGNGIIVDMSDMGMQRFSLDGNDLGKLQDVRERSTKFPFMISHPHIRLPHLQETIVTGLKMK